MTENQKMFSSPGEWKFQSSQLSQVSLTKLGFGLSPCFKFALSGLTVFLPFTGAKTNAFIM